MIPLEPVSGSVERHSFKFPGIDTRQSKLVEITAHSSSLEPTLRDDKPDFTGYNMKSFDQNQRIVASLEPAIALQ